MRASWTAAIVVLCVGCGSERRVSAPSGSGSSRSDGGGDAQPVRPTGDGGPQITVDSGPPVDAGPCTYPAVQQVDQPCCTGLGPDACAPNLFCAALDGRAIAVCYALGSRQLRETCSGDAQCASGSCGQGRCASAGFQTIGDLGAYLETVTLVSAGSDIASHPFGYSEDVNFGSATQCYRSVELALRGGRLTQTALLGELEGAPATGDLGTCNHDAGEVELQFQSTAFLLSNLRGGGECFDVDVSYPAFGYEGRGRIEADGRLVMLEVFFDDQALGHRCADGAVGTPTVRLNGSPFAGDAVMRFRPR